MSRDRVPRWLVTYLPKYIKLCYFYMYASQQSPYFMAIRHTLLTSVYRILCTEPNDLSYCFGYHVREIKNTQSFVPQYVLST
jgi:hypothetical protein